MKTFASTLLCLGLAQLAFPVSAQTFTIIKSFGDSINVTGHNPEAGLTQGPDGTLYGTASGGPGIVRGIVFRVNSDGTGFAPIKLFTNHFEGGYPQGGLVLSGSTLYGTTSDGGTNTSSGTIFKMNTNGTGYTVLKHLSETIGRSPQTTLTLSGSTLYGTAYEGGTDNYGTVFKINTDGSGFAVLRNFSSGDDAGYHPLGRLVEAGGLLYGTTYDGGTNGGGVLFSVSTSGTGYTVLTQFGGTPDAGGPSGALTLVGNTLFGTTQYGGTDGSGTVFKVNTNGTGFAILRSFGADPDEGLSPYGGVVLSGATLYGTAYSGGAGSGGTIFRVGTNGSGFVVLRSMESLDGYAPAGELVLSGGTLIGTMIYGGNGNVGTIFKIGTSGSDFAVLKHFSFGLEEGNRPSGGVVLSGGTLFGTTSSGGTNGLGAIFKVNTNGSGFAVIRQMSAPIDNFEGIYPYGRLVLSSNTLYGTASGGGSFGNGTVFSLNTNGGGLAALKSFPLVSFGDTNLDGAYPDSGVTLSGSTLYGTTYGGGTAGEGTLFKVNTDGGSFSVLKHFSQLTNDTNTDGAYPEGGMIVSGSTLYGTAQYGGSAGVGTLFKMDVTGSGFGVLHSFAGGPGDGTYPSADLTLGGATLFGTTWGGGSADAGTVFKVDTNGGGYTVLKGFAGPHFEGAKPASVLTLSGSMLYGTTYEGGTFGLGTVFQINTNGGDYVVLKHFAGPDGAKPVGSLTMADTTLYGITTEGGVLGLGTVFKVDLASASAPQLSIARSNLSAVISWPWPSSGFALQQNDNVTTTNWTSVTNSVSNDGFYNTVIVPANASARFYRLKN